MRCPPPQLRAFAVCIALITASFAATAQTPTCAAAADVQERARAIPRNLLRSIATVESADRPWSVNADGVGRSFETKRQAIDFVREAAGGGARFIDVGCFQIDLRDHPDAFTDLDQAFDPAANAAYAARFLASLHEAAGDWRQAVGDYHSRDALRGRDYRDRVFAALTGSAWTAPVVGQWFGMRVIEPGAGADGAHGLPRVYEP